MDALSPAQKAKAENLVKMGLPEEAAVRCSGMVHKPTSKTALYYTLAIKDDADMAAVETQLKAYAAASKASKGKVGVASYSISGKDVVCIDVQDSPSGMDIHIGNCFPAYVTMLGAGVEMKEIIAICDDPKEIDWWKGSLAAWGATKLIITAAM